MTAADALIRAALLLATASPATADGPSPERSAVLYLAKEVPAWSPANRCFSCHNNGDAARALVAASRDAATPFDPKALADTRAFLGKPEAWNEHEAEAPNKDARLARVQFTSAMVAALESPRDRELLIRAAETLAGDQADDGCWPIEADDTLGSPATYGRALATSRARTTLSLVDARRFARPIEKADRWLRDHPIRNVPEASAVLLGLPDVEANRKARKQALVFLVQAQGEGGGWGPHARSAAEPFDTALAVLSLAGWPDRDEVRDALRRGRKALIADQLADGSWPETTRPPGAESYAQRLSTAGWATLALLASR